MNKNTKIDLGLSASSLKLYICSLLIDKYDTSKLKLAKHSLENLIYFRLIVDAIFKN